MKLLCTLAVLTLRIAAAQETADAALALLKQSTELYSKADYTGAKARAHEARDLYQRLYGPENAGVARALSAEATAMLAAGDYRAATPLFEQALEIARKDPGPEHRDTVAIMERFAVNLTRAGEYARAKVLEEQSLALSERLFGADDTLTATALAGLGQILVQMGDYASSQQYQRRALAIMEESAGKESLEVANTLVGMGNNARDAHDYVNAKSWFERAAAIYAAKIGPRDTRVGGALDNLGQTLLLMRRLADARPILDRALSIQTEALGPRHPWTANVIQGQAILEAALGNYQKSRDLYRQNIEIWSEALGPEHPFTMVSLTELSDVEAHLGHFADALATALQAAGIRRDNIVRTVRTVDERQALRYAALHSTSMDTALTIASRPEASAADRAQVWDALIRSRALVLDEMSARQRSIRESTDPQVATLEQQVASGRELVTKLVLQGPAKLSLAEYSKRLQSARSQWERAGTELAVKSAAFRHEWSQQRAGFAEMQVALPAGSALVAYRRYRLKNYQAPGDAATDSYLAFVLSGPGAEPAVIRLGNAATIEAAVAKWRAEIDRERGSLGRSALANEAQYRTAATALRQAVWDPVQKRLGSAARVFIVPDGALQLVNFAALPADKGGYLVESCPLLPMLSTERDLAAPDAIPSGTELLVVADPEFAARPATTRGLPSTCADFASLEFGSLPGSRAEAQVISRIWTAEGWHGFTLTGAGATQAALKSMAPGKRVLHIATHGFFLDAQCSGSSVARENPLLRAGLALTRAHGDDGILTAEEAAALDLRNTEWVVLSGCDTGVGDIQDGEGVLGLRRAFQEAGARTLIASLWPVDDQATRQWMGTLYRSRFHSGKGTAESVRAADLGELRARRQAGKSTHPFYWAGFVAVGDWR